jgi:hypothetical protein
MYPVSILKRGELEIWDKATKFVNTKTYTAEYPSP